MSMHKGRMLRKGDRIGLTAPAGPVSRERLAEAVAALEQLGYEVQVGFTCLAQYGGYLAGSAHVRARELNWMFASPDIQAIICLRGGYGSPQILPLLDYKLIAQHPKLFIGYSDITALHIALQQHAQLATIHGPMAATDLIAADDFTITSFFDTIKRMTRGKVTNPNEEKIETVVPGRATGLIIGGNLSLISQLMGTPYEIDVKNKILFLEEIGEPPYKVDRMFTQLALAGKFLDATGIILGTWIDCQSDNHTHFSINDLIEQIIVPYEKPTIVNVRAGHCLPMVTIPFGVKAMMDATKGEWFIEESVILNE